MLHAVSDRYVAELAVEPDAPPLVGIDHRELSVRWILLAKCVENARDHIKRDAALEMEAGPPKPACRSRLQTTISCVGQKPRW